jgi:ABC-type enterochelin transport system substrate-binding protein
MSKQTAVEWLIEQLFFSDQSQTLNQYIEQAKAMEREQIIDAYTECWMMDGGNGNHKLKEANEYFNETYGGDK